MHSAECDTDNSLERGKFKLHVSKKTRMPGVKTPKRFDVNKIKQKDAYERFIEAS